jgi:hypothetical protein
MHTVSVATTSRKRQREDVEQGSNKRATTEKLQFNREVQPALDNVRCDTAKQSKWRRMPPIDNSQPFYSSCFGIDDNMKWVSSNSGSLLEYDMLNSRHRKQSMQHYVLRHPVEGSAQDLYPKPPNPNGLAVFTKKYYGPQLGHVNPHHQSRPVQDARTTSFPCAVPSAPSEEQKKTQANILQVGRSGSRYSSVLFQGQALVTNVETSLEHCKHAPQPDEPFYGHKVTRMGKALYTSHEKDTYTPSHVQL